MEDNTSNKQVTEMSDLIISQMDEWLCKNPTGTFEEFEASLVTNPAILNKLNQ